MLRKTSVITQALGPRGLRLLAHATGSIQRLLPHATVEPWQEGPEAETRVSWSSPEHAEIEVTIGLRSRDGELARSLSSSVRRRRGPRAAGRAWQTMDRSERVACRLAAQRVAAIVRLNRPEEDDASLTAVETAFDEGIVASLISEHHQLELGIADLFGTLHRLAEQTHENQPLEFGCVIDPTRKVAESNVAFPTALLQSKKYRALSNGRRTAYHVSANGRLIAFRSLEEGRTESLGQKHFFPFWSEAIASRAREGRCAIALTRHGDILVFDRASLSWTYRSGQWQLWNHGALTTLLRDLLRAPDVQLQTTAKVVNQVYRSALDAAFSRRGALFVVLSRETDLGKLVRPEDRMGHRRRTAVDAGFDAALREPAFQSLPRNVIAELASLDGAMVMGRSGRLLAHGAVLRPRRQGQLQGTEGSRTQAAIGASTYGVALKVSADGDLTIYQGGCEYLSL